MPLTPKLRRPSHSVNSPSLTWPSGVSTTEKEKDKDNKSIRSPTSDISNNKCW